MKGFYLCELIRSARVSAINRAEKLFLSILTGDDFLSCSIIAERLLLSFLSLLIFRFTVLV